MNALEQLDRTILLCRDYVADATCNDDICRAFQSLRVLCVADDHNLATLSGQTALFTLVSLLGRMGMQVGLEIPQVPMVAPQTPFFGDEVREALIGSSESLITGATVVAESYYCPDLISVLGNSGTAAKAPLWSLTGDEWSGALRLGRGNQQWTAQWPVGGMVAAALAAGEAFKFVMRRLPFRVKEDYIFFQASEHCYFDFGFVPLPRREFAIDSVDVISAGAISQAALFALARLPDIRMSGRIFDDDVTAASNLNRNMLTLATDVGVPKVMVAEKRCGPNLTLKPIEHRLRTAGSRRWELSGRVIVGVDDIPSRWAVQRHAPGWVGVSGTSHFSVISSDHRPTEPCCGCLHPVDDSLGANPIPTISFVSFWAGLSLAVRLVREALVNPYSRDRQQLWLTPLRLDQPHAAMWMPVARRSDCPVRCASIFHNDG